jgi:biotin operon repressor
LPPDNRDTNMQTYGTALNELRALGHSNKCVVIAASVLFNMTYTEALGIIDALVTRKVPKNGGYYRHEYMPIYKDLAAASEMSLQLIPLDTVRRYAKTGKSFTPRVARALGITDGIIQYRSHVAAIKDGKIEDWSDGRQNRIQRVYMLREKHTAPRTIPTITPKRANVQEAVLALLTASWVSIEDMAKQLGVKEVTVRTKISRLRAIGKNIKREGKLYYCLPIETIFI